MFLNPKILKKLMKEAYKRECLVIGKRDEQYYIQGGYWALICKKNFVPKTILAEIIELAGEIPEEGECFCAGKNGNQMQANPMVAKVPVGSLKIRITRLILESRRGVYQRVLQFEHTKEVLLVDNVFMSLVSKIHCEFEEGETEPNGPFCNVERGVFWENNVMTLQVLFRVDDENEAVLKQLEMANLMPDEKYSA